MFPKPEIPSAAHVGLSSVFAAAVVNENFRNTLLSDPESAIIQGYLGQPFVLTREDKEFLLSIDVSSLSDFAKQILLYTEG